MASSATTNGYDAAGNRTLVVTDGVTSTISYNAANQVIGDSYDAAGNLLSDGTTSSTYDALNRMVSSAGTSFTYNGDGVLVRQTTGTTTTHYTQNLASSLSQILNDGTANYVYGSERLFSDTGK